MRSRRVVIVGKDEVALRDVDLPAMGSGDVLVETLYSTISPGTELANVQLKPNTSGKYPLYPGYSACCRILEKGKDVANIQVGQLAACKSSHASHTVIPATRCRPIPENLAHEEASVFRLASISLQGVRKSQIQLGQEVAVVGLGPIGLLAAQLARAAGATYVEGIDVVDWRRELSLKCGLDAVAASAEAPVWREGFHAVIESTGVPEVLPASFRLARKLGTVALLGCPRGVTDGVNFYSDVQKKGITIVSAHEATRPAQDDYKEYCTHQTDETTVLKLMAAGRIQVRPLISDIIPASKAPSAYERLAKRQEQLMLVVLKWKEA